MTVAAKKTNQAPDTEKVFDLVEDAVVLATLCLAWKGTSRDSLKIILDQAAKFKRTYQQDVSLLLGTLMSQFTPEAKAQISYWFERENIDPSSESLEDIVIRFSKEIFPTIALSGTQSRQGQDITVSDEVNQKILGILKGKKGVQDFSGIRPESRTADSAKVNATQTASDTDSVDQSRDLAETQVLGLRLMIKNIKERGVCCNCLSSDHPVAKCPDIDRKDAYNNLAAYLMKDYEKVFQTTRPKKLRYFAKQANKLSGGANVLSYPRTHGPLH